MNPASVIRLKTTIQPNGHDCGLHVIIHVRSLLRRVSSSHALNSHALNAQEVDAIIRSVASSSGVLQSVRALRDAVCVQYGAITDDQFFGVQSKNFTNLPSGPTGLVNIGNTCFINATIQCFHSIPAFAPLFSAQHQCSVIAALAEVMQDSFTDKIVAITKLTKAAGAFNEQWDNRRQQQSAAEWLGFLIQRAGYQGFAKFDSPFMELLEASEVNCRRHPVDQALCIHKMLIQSHGCPIVPSSGSSSIQSASTLMFSGILQDTNLDALLHVLTDPATLEARCPTCLEEHKQANQRVILHCNAPILVVELVRENNDGTKNFHRVDFPTVLDSHMLTAPGRNPAALYDLCAVTNHIGPIVTEGHYTAHVKRGSSWYLISDEAVSPCDFADVVTVNATLLFYSKR